MWPVQTMCQICILSNELLIDMYTIKNSSKSGKLLLSMEEMATVNPKTIKEGTSMNTLMPLKDKACWSAKFGTALTLTFGGAYSKVSVIYFLIILAAYIVFMRS